MKNLSFRAYAKVRGVPASAVRLAIKSGTIQKNPDGRINAARANAQWDAAHEAALRRAWQRGMMP